MSKYKDVVPARVSKGAALLDSALGPDWPGRIDLPGLNLMDAQSCVLGQLYKADANEFRSGFTIGLQETGLAEEEFAHDAVVDHGFNTEFLLDMPDHEDLIDQDCGELDPQLAYDVLQDEWERVIKERTA